MIYSDESFPSLPNSWEKILVDLACENISVREKVQVKQYKSTGQLAIIDQGANFVGGYTDDNSKLVTDKLPVIVFGDHTRIIKFIDFLFSAGADGIKVLKPKEFWYC